MSPSRVLIGLLLGIQILPALPIPRPPTLRLPGGISPKRYRASLVVTPGKADFSGILTIELQLDKAADQIWINSEELTIESAVVSTGGLKLRPHIVSNVKGFAGFLLDQPLQSGSATLELHYVGKVNDKRGPGLSHSSRNHSDYVVTHFEPIAARRVFPCFDEPNFKVPWQLTINAPAEDMVVSNTGVESDTPNSGRHRVVFRETKPLPSYLIAFTIGEYETIDLGKIGRNRVPARVIVAKGDRPKAGFAVKIVPEIVERLEGYFDIGYPYEKLDEVAVPDYPENSAMEDAGSVLYDDSLILCAPESLTHQTEEQILWIMIHETTHQWFGDLVTFAWWNDAWLNEGLTEWLQWKLQREWGPEWRDDLSAADDLARLVRQDIEPVARPIRQRIDTPGQIETEFDDITYYKTAEVLRMTENYIGQETLRKSIRNYLRAHLFGNATSQDFLNELAKVNAGATLSFEQYLNRTGLPEIATELDCSTAKPIVHLRQNTFRPLGVAPTRADPWIFPVCLAYPDGKAVASTCTLAKEPAFDMELATSVCPAWLLANPDASGYYISRYDQASFRGLLGHLRSLGPRDQIHTLWETGFLVSNGKEGPSRLLDTIHVLGPDFKVSDVLAVSHFSPPLLRYETSPDSYKRLVDYFEGTLGKTGRDLGWAPPSNVSAKQREEHLDAVSSIAILAEDQELIAGARKLSEDWLRDRNSIPADVVGPALLVAGRFATEEFYNRLLHAAREEQDHDRRMKALNGLAFVRDPELIRRNLTMFAGGTFPLGDSYMLFFAPAQSRFHETPEVRRMPLEFLNRHQQQVRSLFPTPLGRDYSSFLAGSASMLCSEQDRKLAETALSPLLLPEDGGKQRLAEAMDAIKLCTAAREATEADFKKALPIH